MNMNRHCRIIKCILSGVVCALLLPVSMQAQKNTAFIPGQVWNDTDGNPIFFITMVLTIGMVNTRKEKRFCRTGLRGSVIVQT